MNPSGKEKFRRSFGSYLNFWCRCHTNPGLKDRRVEKRKREREKKKEKKTEGKEKKNLNDKKDKTKINKKKWEMKRREKM